MIFLNFPKLKSALMPTAAGKSTPTCHPYRCGTGDSTKSRKTATFRTLVSVHGRNRFRLERKHRKSTDVQESFGSKSTWFDSFDPCTFATTFSLNVTILTPRRFEARCNTVARVSARRLQPTDSDTWYDFSARRDGRGSACHPIAKGSLLTERKENWFDFRVYNWFASTQSTLGATASGPGRRGWSWERFGRQEDRYTARDTVRSEVMVADPGCPKPIRDFENTASS